MKTVLISDRLPEEAVAILEAETGIAVANRPGVAGADLTAALADAEGLIVRSGTRVTAAVRKSISSRRSASLLQSLSRSDRLSSRTWIFSPRSSCCFFSSFSTASIFFSYSAFTFS